MLADTSAHPSGTPRDSFTLRKKRRKTSVFGRHNSSQVCMLQLASCISKESCDTGKHRCRIILNVSCTHCTHQEQRLKVQVLSILSRQTMPRKRKKAQNRKPERVTRLRKENLEQCLQPRNCWTRPSSRKAETVQTNHGLSTEPDQKIP